MSSAGNMAYSTTLTNGLGDEEQVNDEQVFLMPSEEELHEGTWLQWPHNCGWDNRHIQRYEESWIQMVHALHSSERVHIIVYNQRQLRRVRTRLQNRGYIDMSKIDFWICPTDDVWIRDNGPIFVRDMNGNIVVENWAFNGWGGKANFYYDNQIPAHAAKGLGLPLVNIPMINEGGSFEVDGNGTLMAKKSSIINPNRNPGLTLADAEMFFRKYLGVTNFVWLEGEPGLDTTDDHIDGTARFAGENTIVTLFRADFSNPSDYDVIQKARNTSGELYKVVHLPMTRKTILTSGFEGIYVNYYVGNEVVLVPTYNDPMDKEALQILGNVYPSRRIVGINMEEAYADGGAVHCATQQQPIGISRGEGYRAKSIVKEVEKKFSKN
jgi:agmatine deiminase